MKEFFIGEEFEGSKRFHTLPKPDCLNRHQRRARKRFLRRSYSASRKVRFESFEPRILLSGDHNILQKDIIDSGLQKLDEPAAVQQSYDISGPAALIDMAAPVPADSNPPEQDLIDSGLMQSYDLQDNLMSTDAAPSTSNGMAADDPYLPPLGSLVHTSTVPASFEIEGEIDTYTLDLDAGQNISLGLVPKDASINYHVEVLNPSGASLGIATAPGAGLASVWQNLSINDSGVYSIIVTNLAGTGAYDAIYWLNASVETEHMGGDANNDLSSAVDINPSAVSLPNSADRLAVIGRTDDGTADIYGFSLDAGQVATIGLTATQPPVPEGATGSLELLDSLGNVLTLGQMDVWDNVDFSIHSFVAQSADTYYARVTGTPDIEYSLIVTRSTDFDLEPNSSINDAQPIDQTGRVLGNLGSVIEGSTAGEIRVAVLGGGNTVYQLNDDTYYDFTASSVTASQIDTVGELNNYDVVVLGASQSKTGLNLMAPALRQWVEAGNGVVATGWTVYYAGLSSGAVVSDIDAIVPVNLASSRYYDYYPTITITDSSHPVTDGVVSFTNNYNYAESTYGGVDAGATILGTVSGYPAIVVGEPGSGRGVYLSPVYPNYSWSTGDADRLLEQAVAWAAGGGTDRVDQYKIQVNAGDNLVITTTTPFDGSGEPVNDLDPILELYDPSGTLVASNNNGAPDGRNALITHTASATGAYRVRVAPVTGSGDYTLNIEGATGTVSQPLSVIGSSVADGAMLNIFPSSVTLSFSQPVLLTSMSADDLIVGGNPASSVIAIDAQTLQFDTSLTNTGDNTYNVSLPVGALQDIYGNTNTEFSMSFAFDSAPPEMTSSSIAEGDGIGSGPFTFTANFSEELASADLAAEDITLIEQYSGNAIAPTSFVYHYLDADPQLTVEFPDLADGRYTLTLKSGAAAFRDLAGNPLGGGSDITINFSVDSDTLAYPVPLEAKEPLGSLIYDPQAQGVLYEPEDTDTFTIDLDGGQRIAVGLFPIDQGLRAFIEVSGPAGSLGSFDAASPGDVAALNNLPIDEAGTYEITVGNLQDDEGNWTEGRFELDILLNAAGEEEGIGWGTNDDMSSAQDLDASFINLENGATRGAVRGELPFGSRELQVASEGFEISGSAWSFIKDNENAFVGRYDQGRTDNYSLGMWGDYGTNSPALNEAVWTVDLTSVSNATLRFWLSSYDEGEPFEGAFTGSFNADGIAISNDNTNWYPIFNMPTDIDGSFLWTFYEINLSAAAESYGLDLSDIGFIKFQQYSDESSYIDHKVRYLDDVSIVTNVEGGVQEDWYRFTSSAGQNIALALKHEDYNQGANILLDLYDSSGVLLTSGIAGAANVDKYIRGFVPQADDTYFVKVSGDAPGDYNLVITRRADFDLELGDQPSDAQDLTGIWQVLGGVGGIGSGSTGGGASGTTSLGVNLYDASGYQWDIQSDGNIYNGTNDAYDGGLYHADWDLDYYFPSFSTALTEHDGREIVIGPATINGVQVTRKIYVPTDQSFARFLEIVYNPGSSTVNYTVPISTNLGSDSSTQCISTSSGDTTFDSADNWIVTDDYDGSGDPTMLHVIAGDNARLRPTGVSRDRDDLYYKYNLALEPGETKIVMHFASQGPNQATALEQAPQLTNLELNALQGMSAYERNNVVNFDVGDPYDQFRFGANEGDVLVITTSTPGDDSGEPVNELDVRIDLYAPDDMLVASDDNSGADGRNARIEYTVPTGSAGEYRIEVWPVNDTKGNYILSISGATGALPEFVVTSTNPVNGAPLTAYPANYIVDFSSPVLLSSVDTSDLTINDRIPADSVTVIDQDTLSFDISSANTGEGFYNVSIGGEAISSLSGQPVETFTATFIVDTTPPTVVYDSVGGNVASADSVYVVIQFSEPMNSAIGTEDIQLINTISEVSYPTSVNYDQETNTATISYDGVIPEGRYELTLFSGPLAFRDLAGKSLDGDNDGIAGGNYVTSFIADVDTRLYPTPLKENLPAGSLIYSLEDDDNASGYFHDTGDVDIFNLALDAGQTLSVVLVPEDQTFRGRLEVFDPVGASIGYAEASYVGSITALQTLAINSAGTYRIQVTSLEGTGRYKAPILLNAAYEEEGIQNDFEVLNNTRVTAQNIDSSFINLADGSSRGAVQGRYEANLNIANDDWYSFTLDDDEGQAATLTLTNAEGSALPVINLELYDNNGSLLAQGISGATNVNQYISGFVPSVGGTYYARIFSPTTDQGYDYNLVITKGAEFDLEPNTDDADAQDISLTHQALGGLRGGSQIQVAVIDNGYAGSAVAQLNDDTYFDFNAVLVNSYQIDTVEELQAYDAVVIGDWIDQYDLEIIAPALRSWVEAGGGVVGTGWLICQTEHSPLVDINAVIPVNTYAYEISTYDSTLTIIDGSHPVTDGLSDFYVANEIVSSSGGVDAGATLLGQANGIAAIVVGEPGSGRSVFLGPTYMNAGYGLQSGPADRLLEQAVAWAAIDTEDSYYIQAEEGQTLDIRTSTPGDGSGEPVNNLDPRLELYNPMGFLVASDDNGAGDGHNARISYPVPAGSSGLYEIRVIRSGDNGDYILHMTGNTQALGPAPEITAVTPASGANLIAPPASLLMTFSEGLRIDSVQTTDLTIDGGAAVTGLEWVDGKTVRFLLNVPDVAVTYNYSISADAMTDLQGVGDVAYSGTFSIDRTGPRVVSQIPALQSIAPFNELTFVFNEPLAAASVSTADIYSFTGPGGTNLLSQVTSVSVPGSNLTVRFNNQNAMGTYTMVIGPNITDAVGNVMDQNQNGTGGETADRYTATIDLQSPDLQLTSLIIPSNANFGQTIEVSWTVRNIGSDPAREEWSDRIYLSNNNTLDESDTVLFTNVANASPLSVLQEYTRTANVTLPLNMQSASGTYYIFVKADVYGQQPESSETNNTRFEAISLQLPPLPDLMVSEISAPVDAISGQTIPVSWTITNQGTATASGRWNDVLWLSSDSNAGNDQWFGAFEFEGEIAAGQSITRIQNITLPGILSGDRWFIVTTDYNNQIFEHARENNNTTIDDRRMTVFLQLFPNLQVTNVIPPTEAFSSQQTVVEWEVTNTGNGATSSPTWYDDVYLSLDRTFDASDTYLGHAQNPSYLGVGDSYHNSLTVTMPRGIEGNFYFLIITDGWNYVFEYGHEDDNVGASGVVPVHLTPPPDLQVTNVNAPFTAYSGQPMNISWTVSNEGPGRTLETAWYDQIYMSSEDETLDAGDRVLDTVYHQGPLNPGDNYTGSHTVNLPIGVSGEFFFFVRTDLYNHVYEHTYENNNVGYDTSVTNVLLTPPPDLEVVNLTAPDSARAGQSLAVSYEVANYGSTQTPNWSWIDSFYLSADTTISSDDISLGDRWHYGALDVDRSYALTENFALANGLTGTYYVLMHTDRDDRVFELNNENNKAASIGTVNINSLPADLVVTAAAVPNTGEAGKQIRVDWTVENHGIGDTIVSNWTDRIILYPAGGGSGTVLADFGHSGLIPAAGSYSHSELVNIPFALTPGSYNIYVITDLNNNVYEGANDGNNTSPALPIAITRETPDLQITSVSGPASATAGDQVAVEWMVKNFGANQTKAGFWYDNVYLSLDTTISGDDRLLGGNGVRHTNDLNALEQYTAAETFTLPSDLAAGNYYFLVFTDSNNRVIETSDSNNDRASDSAINIAANPKPVLIPDLVLSSVDAPAEAVSGQAFNLSWTVRNDGDPTGNRYWYDAVYLSRDQYYDRYNDTYLGYKYHFGGLNTGGEYTANEDFTVPNGLSVPFYVFVIADSGNYIAGESSESNNKGYDSGIMSVSLAPPADLVAGVVSFPDMPATGTLGQNMSITYSVTNASDIGAMGNWQDSIYLSADTTCDVNDLLFARVDHSGGLAAHASYSHTATASVPGILPGDYHVIIRSDIRNQVPEGNEVNNLSASLDQTMLDADSLTLGVAVTGTLAQGQSSYYKLVVPAGETIRIALDSDSDSAANEVYVRYGAMPTRGQFDYSYSQPFNSDQEVTVSGTRAGTYYILAYGSSSPGGPSNFTIGADTLQFSISDVTPDQGSNVGQVTLTLEGVKFSPDAVVSLIAQNGAPLEASTNRWVDSSTIWATFDLRSLTPGAYDVRIDDDGQSAVEEDGFTVTTGAQGNLEVRLSLPSALRPGQLGVATVEYANIGETDISAPFLTLSADAATLKPSGAEEFSGSTLQFLGINPDGPAGILTPGAKGTFTVMFRPTISGGQVNFTVSELQPSNNTLDWDGLKEAVQPFYVSDEAWEAMWHQYTSGMGQEADDYLITLADNATRLSQLGEYTSNIGELMQFELLQASNVLPGAILETAVDAATAAPGLSLAFTRSYDQSLIGRNTLGPLGYGWSHQWQISAMTDNEGNVSIIQPGAVRFFQLQDDGSYRGQTGVYGTLTLQGGSYSLIEANGTIVQFRLDGQWGFIADTNGNRLNAGYEQGRLTTISHANGETLTLSYNAQGRIETLTDEIGGVTAYSYDASGTLLTSVAGSDGTTEYAYESGHGEAREHALLSITYPGGYHSYFQYDDYGRLVIQQRDNGAEAVSYSYDSVGGVSLMDALGATTTLLYNDFGTAGQIYNPLGDAIQMSLDDKGNLVSITDPTDRSYEYAYNDLGKMVRAVDPLGHTTLFTYAGLYDQLQSVSDANGNRTDYAYDTDGNLTSITYADGSYESWTYDDAGNPETWTNRRGNATPGDPNDHKVVFTYDTSGRVTTKTYADGSLVEYHYDGRGNLDYTVDASGTTDFTYNAKDELARIDYPGGQWLEFTYNDAGQRISSLDQLGHRLEYHYDAVGRLDYMMDESGQRIVDYDYDAVGRIIRKDLGNGVYTTYDYDVAGQLLLLVNCAPDGSVLSRFDYTYDGRGLRTSMDTSYGKWTYEYDDIGQLTHAALNSTDPAIPDQDLTYVYDAAGNRIRTIENGVTREYTTNNLNQYTQVDDTTYVFDADGNLIQEISPEGTTTYTYNDENRLTAVSSPEGQWQYVYDALGNRISSIVSGVATSYLIDPVGLGNVTAEYNGTGSLIANYDYGYGLVSRVDASGNPAYYAFSGVGNTTELTSAGGAILTTYSYDPFGIVLGKTENAANPFEFVGQLGVMNEGNGLRFMRARYYEPSLGRFLQTDPIGLLGNDVNLYRYGINSPSNATDSSGLLSVDFDVNKQNWDKWQQDRHTTNYWWAAVQNNAMTSSRGWNNWIYSGVDVEWQTTVSVGAWWGFGMRTPLVEYFTYFAEKSVWLGLNFVAAYVTNDWNSVLMKFRALYTSPDLTEISAIEQAYADRIKFWSGVGGGHTQIVRPSDPNDIVGPGGFGEEHWVSSTQTLSYTVNFENAPDATAPAQQVIITTQLDPDLDPRTFRLDDFGWGDLRFDLPGDKPFYSQRLDLTQQFGYFVDVAASVDIQTGVATWTLTTIDPATGEQPENAQIGFLPVNNENGIGEGFVSYTAKPQRTTDTGDVIDAQARIIFDTEAPIDTPPIFNTLDALAPSSTVTAIPVAEETEFVVSWAGSDDDGGSAIGDYTIYVSDNGEAFDVWLNSTTWIQASFLGEAGHHYAFYSIARDNAGNTEHTPAIPDAQIILPGGNEPPISLNDVFTTDEDTSLTIAAPGVLLNDSDIDYDPLNAVLVNDAAHGIVNLNLDGSFTYTPTLDYNGSDSFTYKANDGLTDSGIATVTLTINSVNDVPIVVNDAYTTDEDTLLTVSTTGVLANDTDVEGNTLTAAVVAGPTHGTLILNGDGSFTYMPELDYNGADSFTYKANDGTIDSNVATVSITVNQVNDAPVATGDSYTTNEDTALVVSAPGILGNDNDLDHDVLSASLVIGSGPANGTLTHNANGSFTYTPAANFNGTDSFTYMAYDGVASSNEATVSITVTPVNDAPVAANDLASGNEDTIITGNVLTNDTDVDADTLTASVVTGPANGTLSLNADGSFTYTPADNFNGTDSFTYKAFDGSAESTVATVNITVNPANDAPTAAGDSYTTDEDTDLIVAAPGILDNDLDLDGDALSASLLSGPTNGTLSLNADGSFTYTPAANFNGADSFTYKANDGLADSNVAMVTISVTSVNDAAVADVDSYSTAEDTTLTVLSATGVLANDSDVDSDPLSALLVSGPAHGSLAVIFRIKPA
jgi:RHS repeat-associated protein